MNILVLAYACEPDRGSEPGIGWNSILEISKSVDQVCVLTRKHNKEIIDIALKKKSIKNVRFVHFDLPKIFLFLKQLGNGQLYYYFWSIKAYFIAKKLNKKIHFDMAHHVTYVNDWLPSYSALLPIPFVWGPVGGSNMRMPLNFYRYIGVKNTVKEFMRNSVQNLFIYLGYFYKLTLKRSKKIIVCNKDSYYNVPKKYHYKTEIHTQIGISNVQKYQKRHNKKLKVVYGGLLLYWKGINLALDGFIEFHKTVPNSEFIIIGSGPEEQKLRKVVKENNLDSVVKFINFLPQKEFMNELSGADIFLFPSFHDSGGMVVVEAMSYGVPVVCLDAGGPSFSVTEKTGIKIKSINPNQTIKSITNALIKLANNPDLREQMGKMAIERVKIEFLWENKKKLFKRIYSEVKK
jgi:glycosyltransferase involved in cell wall biosynthesis